MRQSSEPLYRWTEAGSDEFTFFIEPGETQATGCHYLIDLILLSPKRKYPDYVRR